MARRNRRERSSIEPKLFAGALAMGMLTSLIAALLPANAAASVDPVKALQKGRSQSLSEGESRARTHRSVCVRGAFGRDVALQPGRYSVLLRIRPGGCRGHPAFSHAGVVAGTRRCVPSLPSMRPVEGALAADSLIQAPRRTSGTVAALMLSLALVVSLGGVARSSYQSLSDWMKIALDPDLFVTTAESITARSFVFPASLGDGLRTIDGIAQVQMVRSVRLQVKGSPIILIALDVDQVSKRARLPAVEGVSDEMYRLAAQSKGVIASENFAQLHGARMGESPGNSLTDRSIAAARCRHCPRFFGPARQPADLPGPVHIATGTTTA